MALQATETAPQGALYDPSDPATPYRQGAQDDHALHAALRQSMVGHHRGGSDTEEHLRSAIAASLEVSTTMLLLEEVFDHLQHSAMSLD